MRVAGRRRVMTRQTRFLAFAIAVTGVAAGCYTAPALTYDPIAPPEADARAAPAKDEGTTRTNGDDAAPVTDAGDAHPEIDAAIHDSGEGGARDAGPVSVTCTSATYWSTTAPAAETMHPGKSCIACHSATGGPAYTLAGTVYPSMHEPDDCNGVDGTLTGMTILVIDAAGTTHTIPVDEAGNFKRVTGMPMPYRAMVISGSNVREMRTPQYDGDCNGCHSVLGNKSPGRVVAP